jgi:CheY-like chemotaxis protein
MEAVGRLAGGVAHDFNNLLTVIRGRSEILLRRLAPDIPWRQDIDLIEQTAERAAALTRQLLAFSRKQVLQPKVLELNAIVAGMDSILRRLIGEHIELVWLPGPALGCVRADPGQLEQVVMNLVVNARDAMPRGGRLTLETGSVELDDAFVRRNPGARAGTHVMLAVTDTGVGMNEFTKAHLFEPFFTTRGRGKGKGTGLGLATVYGIVRQSGGYIHVESELGRGARFRIYLPRVEAVAEDVEPSPAAARPLEGRETVLLVEDEEKVRGWAREVLGMYGYTVLEASNGIEALGVAERHDGGIHLLLTDVVMPHMSGRELADRLSPMRPEMKVLYMSGYTDEAIVHHGVLTAGTVLIQKPFGVDALAEKVREVLGTAEAQTV